MIRIVELRAGWWKRYFDIGVMELKSNLVPGKLLGTHKDDRPQLKLLAIVLMTIIVILELYPNN